MSSRPVTLLEGDTGQKLASTEILVGEAQQLSGSAALLAAIYQAFTTPVSQTNGAPGPTTLNGPAIGVNGAGGGVFQLTFDIAVTDTAANDITLSVTVQWGNKAYSVNVVLKSINGVTHYRVTLPILVEAPTSGTATMLTFINSGLAVGQQLDIAASVDNYSVFQYVGTIFPAAWA